MKKKNQNDQKPSGNHIENEFFKDQKYNLA